MNDPLNQRPLMVAICGPNGAGKSTFYEAHIKPSGLRYVNADVLARELDIESYQAAKVAWAIREAFVGMGESFVFETVLSDPVGDKVDFMQRAQQEGYTVVLCFIGVSGPEVSEQRVSMRVLQGGHDVPNEKLVSRYPRTLVNLQRAIGKLNHVWVFDNDDLREPYRKVAVFEHGNLVVQEGAVPAWLRPVLDKGV